MLGECRDLLLQPNLEGERGDTSHPKTPFVSLIEFFDVFWWYFDVCLVFGAWGILTFLEERSLYIRMP